MFRVFVFCFFACLVHATDEDREYLSESSIRRQQFTVHVDPVQTGFEPILSFGNYFLGRYLEVSWRSTVLPYTKNSTILSSNILSFLLGILCGILLTLYFHRSKMQETVEGETRTKQEDEKKKEEEEEGEKVDSEEEDFLEKSLSLESWTALDEHMANGSARTEIRQAEDKRNTAVSDLAKSIQEMKIELRNARAPMAAIKEATETIANNVGMLTTLTEWIVGRKSKKDKWIAMMDCLSFGVVIMNLSLGIAAFFFGSWQDWGLTCDSIFPHYRHGGILSTIWCYLKEPYYCVLGCVLWCGSTRILSSSGFLKRKEALPTVLFALILSISGLIHSTVVNLLGGSWNIAFTTWFVYSGFLVKILESAKEVTVSENMKQQPQKIGTYIILFSDMFATIVSVFIFPLVVSLLPFWNKGLSLWLYHTANGYWKVVLDGIYYTYKSMTEYGMY